jgi:hypothetical protein
MLTHFTYFRQHQGLQHAKLDYYIDEQVPAYKQPMIYTNRRYKPSGIHICSLLDTPNMLLYTDAKSIFHRFNYINKKQSFVWLICAHPLKPNNTHVAKQHYAFIKWLAYTHCISRHTSVQSSVTNRSKSSINWFDSKYHNASNEVSTWLLIA